MQYSEDFHRLRRQIARRRRDLLRGLNGRNLIYPVMGSAWFPSDREQALCETFIVLFVAELETYLESIVNAFLDSYQARLSASGLDQCGGATDYMDKLLQKRRAWSKNNNTNWKKVEEYFSFVGLNKSSFPDRLWDNIDVVVIHRGDIVHNSLGIRSISDPRITIESISSAMSALSIFDRDFVYWKKLAGAELARLLNTNLKFISGIGTIAPNLAD
jgi:hypothetical protein